MGKASALWTPDYLTSCPEASKIMDVHVCPPKEVSDTGAGTRGGDSDDLIGGGSGNRNGYHGCCGSRRSS